MPELANTIWADGPSSMPTQPQKSQIRSWGTWIEQIIAAFTSNGGLIYSSLALLNADLSKPANSMAWVFGDSVAANNGVYGKVGASGSGSWTRRSDLPFSFIVASDVGAGTPNAIMATTAIPVSQSALVWLQVAQTNTGSPVVVSFNGGGPLVLKTNTGNDPATGGIVAGMVVLGIVSGATFRLVSDQASSAIVAAAEAAAAEAQAAAASVNIKNVATRAQVRALNASVSTLAFHNEGGRKGQFRWTVGDFTARVASDTEGAVYLEADDVSASAGSWVRDFDGGVDIRWFGGVADNGATDNAASFVAAAAIGTQIYIPEGIFRVNATAANFDTIMTLAGRCYGPGVIEVLCGTGFYPATNYYGFVSALPLNLNLRGENGSGTLTAASITFAGTAGNHTAAITFPSLPVGIAVGQLLSLVPTTVVDKRTSQCLLAGANKITSIVGNVVTVSISYHGTITAKMPTIVGSVSFTGSWRLNKSIITYAGSRTPIYVQNQFARINITDVGLTGPYTSGAFVNTSGITVGWIDEDRHYVKDQLRLSGVSINGFASGVLGQGARTFLGDLRGSNCLSLLAGRRQSQFYATAIFVGACGGDAVSLTDNSEIFVSAEVMSCGNSGRGVWAFGGDFNCPGVVHVGYNLGAGGYAKAGANFIAGATSCAFRNNDIGWGNENGKMHVDDTVSEYNLKTGFECGMGHTSAQRIVSRYNENGLYSLVGGTIFADDCDVYGNSQSGAASAELSMVRAYRGKFHDNTLDGVSIIGNSHFRGDSVQINNNGRYGVNGMLNSTSRTPGVTGSGNASGNTFFDPTSSGTVW
ncbi:hypothetical protein [Aliirhizobium cellulosilyticum]|uniref:Pectate lyase superfamily protein domain-containing protein n=1 Tax=Aliirhizobium cellulosilyticum TaxID=393664 RepID=A0A7W6UTV0_9HYPH|nr:hypothetical protein [Rhizobium cellulosilyticum]MBB4348028.1 hypothetical protein [Rhizobium cellulosilyticum]MBB4409578.1 hypothetical protein [Rhizobium cellulosilyticum]MBB4444267.1 hypothetical protein [Rhizobium cellulosilyticum]